MSMLTQIMIMIVATLGTTGTKHGKGNGLIFVEKITYKTLNTLSIFPLSTSSFALRINTFTCHVPGITEIFDKCPPAKAEHT